MIEVEILRERPLDIEIDSEEILDVNILSTLAEVGGTELPDLDTAGKVLTIVEYGDPVRLHEGDSIQFAARVPYINTSGWDSNRNIGAYILADGILISGSPLTKWYVSSYPYTEFRDPFDRSVMYIYDTGRAVWTNSIGRTLPEPPRIIVNTGIINDSRFHLFFEMGSSDLRSAWAFPLPEGGKIGEVLTVGKDKDGLVTEPQRIEGGVIWKQPTVVSDEHIDEIAEEKVDEHANNQNVHVTLEEKENWDKKISMTVVDETVVFSW